MHSNCHCHVILRILVMRRIKNLTVAQIQACLMYFAHLVRIQIVVADSLYYVNAR